MKYMLTVTGDVNEIINALIAINDNTPASSTSAPTNLPATPSAEPERQPEEAPKEMPVSVPSIEEVRDAAMHAINNGKREEVRQLLEAHGAKRVPELAESERAAFLSEVGAL